MRYDHKLDVVKVRAQTEHTITVLRAMVQALPKIENVCKRFDGKKIGKRFEDALKEALPEHHVRLEPCSTSFTNIVVWPFKQYADRHSVFLGYHSEGMLSCFNFDKWLEKTRNENNYAKWLERAEWALANIHTLVEDYNEALQRFEEAKNNLDGLTLEPNS